MKFGSFLSLTVPHPFHSLCPYPSLSLHKHSLFAHSQNLIMVSVRASPFQNYSFKKLFSVKKKKKLTGHGFPFLALVVGRKIK